MNLLRQPARDVVGVPCVTYENESIPGFNRELLYLSDMRLTRERSRDEEGTITWEPDTLCLTMARVYSFDPLYFIETILNVMRAQDQ